MSGGSAMTKPSAIDCASIIGLSVILLSAVGVVASALGGVRRRLGSTPTAGGRPRGNRKLRDTLARFCKRQSDNIDIMNRYHLIHPSSCFVSPNVLSQCINGELV